MLRIACSRGDLDRVAPAVPVAAAAVTIQVCLEECGDSGREGESSNFPLKVRTALATSEPRIHFHPQIVAAAEAAEAIVEKETEFNPELVQAMLPKLHWGAFRSGVADVRAVQSVTSVLRVPVLTRPPPLAQLGIGEVPEALPMGEALTGDVLRALHKFLFDVRRARCRDGPHGRRWPTAHGPQIHLMEGQLVCRHCNRAFPVSNGVPNMLLNEDEV